MLLGADDRKMWDTVSKRGHINALLYSGGDANTIYKNTLGFGTFRLFLRLRTAGVSEVSEEGRPWRLMWDYGVIGSPHPATELRRCQLHAPVFWVV